ncbi:inorganic phosphate transporter Pho88 [Radiomyces spectabilis]|uniref:inorganic phosphate transporter Pho88 n=1 Tax=Radiomyces spectabilis TaxID=64574 RepID=UPI00221EB907|nr:inorganic phosphate transporter Pho88 [Radiomyces spectabilis]KAI8377877.1 inorganic phosphate transporter Pho88 [Radiomyces spectabilis]
MPDWNKILNHPLFNVVFFVFVRQLTKAFHLDQPEYLWPLRFLYIASQLAILALNFQLITQVQKKNDTTILRYVEPSKQNWDGSQEPEQLVNTTVMEYDVNEIKKQMKQGFIGIGMIAVMHWKFQYVQPLILQAILGFKTFYSTKEARIHIWKESATGELRRPFKLQSPFGLMPESKQPKTDKGSIKKAERARKAE